MNQAPITVVSSPKKKNKHEKIASIIVFTVGPILFAFILHLFGVFSFFHVRLFNGDRIYGNIYITVDEKECTPSSATLFFNNKKAIAMTLEDVSYDEETSEELSNITPSNEISTDEIYVGDFGVKNFSAIGGEVGYYILNFTINKDDLYELTGEECVKNLKDDLHIKFKYYNKKWYYITSMNFSIIIISDEKDLSCKITADYYSDNAERYKDTGKETKTFYLNMNPIAGKPADNTIEIEFGK